MKNELWVAGPGSGKSYKLVQTALKNPDKKILLTTFTNSNTEVLRNLFYVQNNCIPPNVTIDSWWAILLRHGIKPFQGFLTNEEITGIHLVNDSSSIIKKGNKVVRTIAEKNTREYYFNQKSEIFTDKIALATVRCNEKSNGLVIKRLSLLFENIMIDEAQDLVGYDLEIIKQLFLSESNVILAADPRQVTYQTHISNKYKKYKQGQIEEFIKDVLKGSHDIQIDKSSLKDSRRCNAEICEFASQLYPEFPIIRSLKNERSDHNGISFIKKSEVKQYLADHKSVQLRRSIDEEVDPNYPVFNFGEAKGATFDHVLIYPTAKMLEWIKNKDCGILHTVTRAKFFVAVTRARFSVAFVLPDDKNESTGQLSLF